MRAMFRRAYHPRAFLANRKNIRPGLEARTRVLSLLEVKTAPAKAVARETGLSYASVLHHLRLLEAENTVARRGRRPYVWGLTGAGQLRLTESVG